MMEYRNSCSLIVNHRFNDAGQYCVNIGVMNDVSGTNTSLMVQIPGGMLPVEGSRTNIVPDWAHFKLTGSISTSKFSEGRNDYGHSQFEPCYLDFQ